MSLLSYFARKYCQPVRLTLCTLFVLWSSNAIAEPSIVRTIEVDFEAVPNATQYELNIFSASDFSIQPLTFIINGVHFSGKIPLGHWKLVVRSLDKRRVGGRWSSLGDFEIKFKTPILLNPKDQATIRTRPDIKKSVIFKWEAFSPLASYNLVIKSKNSPKALLETKVVGGTFTHPLAQGSFTWSITSDPPKGIALDGEDPKVASFDILAGRLAPPIYDNAEKSIPTSFSWQPVPHATSYLVVFQKIAGEDFEPLDAPETMISKSTGNSTENLPPDLKPGAYKISIKATAIGFTDSKASLRQFKVPVPKPKEPIPSKKEVAAPPQKIEAPSIPELVIRPTYFSKTGRLETSGQLSIVMNQSFIYTYLATGLLDYHFSETLAAEGALAFGFSTDKDDKKTLDSNYKIKTEILRTKYFGEAGVLYTPIYAKYPLSDGRLVHFEVFLSAGGGMTGVEYLYDHCPKQSDVHDGVTVATPPDAKTVSYPTGFLGVGQRVYVDKKVRLRWDIRSHFFGYNKRDGACDPSSAESATSSQTNITMQLGAGFFL
jgi:outer membrane beta-barrel protein